MKYAAAEIRKVLPFHDPAAKHCATEPNLELCRIQEISG